MVDTHSAWIGQHEIVSVTYRPESIAFRDLVRTAKAHGCATRVWTTTDVQLEVARGEVGDAAKPLSESIRAAKASDQIYYLERSPLRFLPLTPLQARRVNAALHLKSDPLTWLSPRQRELFVAIEAAVKATPGALSKLSRPSTIEGLAEYQRELSARLAGSSK